MENCIFFLGTSVFLFHAYLSVDEIKAVFCAASCSNKACLQSPFRSRALLRENNESNCLMPGWQKTRIKI